MEKQKKVLNVIKGYMSKFDIEELTIIEDDEDSVIFSGEVKRVLDFNDEKLFIFI